MKYKHIIWDWNGTLIDDLGLCVSALNNGLAKRGLTTITEENFREISTFPVSKIYERVGFDFEKERFEVAGDEFVLFYGKHFYEINLHLKALSVIKEIQILGGSQSILSAGSQEYLNIWINHHALSNYFMFIRGIDNHYAGGKVELGTEFVKELPYNKNEIILVGDTVHDSKVAQAMGVDCLLLDHGHVSRNRLEKTNRKVLSSLSQVLEQIK